MASLFNREPDKTRPLPAYAPDRIESEIAHLSRRTSVRHTQEVRRSLGAWVCVLVALALLGLYCLDPIRYSFKRDDAIHAYLYLHNYGSDAKAGSIVASGILSQNEAEFLNRKQGAFQDYFSGSTAAEHTADAVIAYVHELNALQNGHYDQLDTLDKIRYNLFVRWGLTTPTHWAFLDPSVGG